jgi:flavin reductase (DIM6/NTAB) family NADH-FMN oxidoreductase RutF
MDSAHVREGLKRLLLGSANVRRQCVVGMCEPQSEISAWLHGFGEPLDVTRSNVIASARPLTIGIGIGRRFELAGTRGGQASLKFRETRKNRLLGEISLRMTEAIPVGNDQLCLFETLSSRNYCVPRARLWFRKLYDAWRAWQSERSETLVFRMRQDELRSVFAFYICPRPVVLVTVAHEGAGNIVPMDLIGPVGATHFTLALHNTSAALPLIQQSRRIALSSVPLNHTSLAFELGGNHKKASIDWHDLPFATASSAAFGLPVPQFSLRVREMEIEVIRTLGSHTLFIARTTEDQRWADGPQLFQIHGFYQAWRQRFGRPGNPLERGGLSPAG